MFNALKKTMQSVVNQESVPYCTAGSIPPKKKTIEEVVRNMFKEALSNDFALKYIFNYRSLEGSLLYRKVRLEHPDGRKIIRPIKEVNNIFTFGEPEFPNKKPLYFQERLKLSSDPVFVVEGEKKANILTKLGITAVTSGGAASAASADWTPLQGRKVIIWPDNDQPGKDFAKHSADILMSLGCNVSMIDINKLDLQESEDVVDWLAHNQSATKQEIMQLPVIHYQSQENVVTQQSDTTKQASLNGTSGWGKPLSLLAEPKQMPYPVDALPRSILQPIQEVVDFVQCPFPIAACSAISNLSLAGQCLVDVSRTNGLSGPSSLFFLVIAESGERKTSADNKFSAPIREWEKEMRKAFNMEYKKYSAESYAWAAKEEAIQSLVRTSAKNGEDTSKGEEELLELKLQEPSKPTLKSLIFTDATMEALAHSLHFHFPYGGVFTSEAGSVFGGAGMQKDASVRYLALLNSLWDGTPYKIVRKTSESFTIEDARLSLGLSVQPETLNSFLISAGKNARDIGFLARCLMTKPLSTQGTRMFKEAPENWPALNSYNTRIRSLLALIDPNKPRVMLRLSESAKKLWIDFYNMIEKQLATDGDFTEIRDVASKAADNCARLAGLFHLYVHGTEGEVSSSHLEMASRIIEWHLYQAREYLANEKDNAQAQDSNLLKEWLIKECLRFGANSVKYSSVLQSGPNPLRKKEALSKALDALAKANMVRVNNSSGTKLIDVNPELLVRDAANDTKY